MVRFLLFFLLCSTSFNAQHTLPKALVEELNQAISQRKTIEAKKTSKIDSLKQVARRCEINTELYTINEALFEEYRYFQCDSALKIAQQTLSIAQAEQNLERINQSMLSLSYILSTAGLTKEAYDCVSQINSLSLNRKQMPEYLTRIGQVYFTMNENAIGTSYSNTYYSEAVKYRKMLLNMLDLSQLNSVEYLCRVWYDRESSLHYKNTFLDLKQKARLYSHEAAMLNFQLAMVYQSEGQWNEMIESLFQSAIADMKLGVRDHYSLQLLATKLFEAGEIDLAYRYILISHEDAIFFNTRQRTVDLAKIYPRIEQAYLMKEEQFRLVFVIASVLLCAIALMLIAIVIFTRKQVEKITTARNQLQQANDKLNWMNHELENANHIKEEYIGQFLSLCSAYIGKLESYQKLVVRKIKNGKGEELVKSLTGNKLIDEELKEFYLRFDISFLRIYPNFVDEFNKLLQEQERIVLKRDELLNTELRIFALIRLGINDSSRIAEFLRYSPNSIYNYRARVKNKAAGKREDFETRVMTIGNKYEEKE